MKMPDMGDGNVYYLVRLSEPELNAIHGATGFLNASLTGFERFRAPIQAREWGDQYLPHLVSASNSIAQQTEGRDAAGNAVTMAPPTHGPDQAAEMDEQHPAAWGPKPTSWERWRSRLFWTLLGAGAYWGLTTGGLLALVRR